MGVIQSTNHLLKTGEKLIIRNGNQSDALSLIKITRSVMEEGEFVISTPEEFIITKEEEEKWIQGFIDNDGKLLLVAEVNNRVIGWLIFQNQPRKKLSHTGEFGITIRNGWRDKGIGRVLIKELLNWAEENPMIKKVGLAVFSTNDRAIHLYKSLGFHEEGRRVQHIKLADNHYVDDLLMYKLVK